MNVRRIAGIGTALALGITVTGTMPAMATDGDVIKQGSCSGSTNWKLKAGPQDGDVEVEAEVDSNRNGQSWRWRIVQNGSVVARGKSLTGAPSGSFTVRRVLVDRQGTDRIAFRAVRTGAGEVCRGAVQF